MASATDGIHREAGRFAIAGLLSTGVNFGVYVLLYAAGLPLVAATVGGYAAGLAVSFELGRRWVFRSETALNAATMLRFAAVYAVGGVGMAAIIEALVRWASFDYRIAWVAGAAFAVASNFAGSRWIVFMKNKVA